MRKTAALVVMFLVVAALTAAAGVKLPALFDNHMVIQRDVPVPIWGWADPGERISVAVGGKTVSTVAGKDGRWRVAIGPYPAGGPHAIVIKGNNSITLEDVLVGEVWIGSGQSNMEWSVRRAARPQEEIAAAKYPRLRLFTVKRCAKGEPQRDCTGNWDVCTPTTVRDFSAVAYFFGRELHRKLGVPVGLIHSSWGGTPAEAWTRRPALERLDFLRPMLARFDKAVLDYPQASEKHKKLLARWEQTRKQARTAGKKPPRRPWPPMGPDQPRSPSALFNGMIEPILPVAFRGVIWYQGEANARRAWEYRRLFPAMITDWRAAWGRGDFPFLFVQLANFRKRNEEPGDSQWAELREAQNLALKLPATGMAVIIDIGEARDIHPKNKQDVGRRLALAARAVAYGEKLVHSGPIYKSMRVDGQAIRISFDHVGGGLVGRGKRLVGFQIAGADRKFMWAEARIDGGEVIVTHPDVSNPVHVRYAWADNPACNLYNKEGLPASPFRTDDWPGITQPKG